MLLHSFDSNFQFADFEYQFVEQIAQQDGQRFIRIFNQCPDMIGKGRSACREHETELTQQTTGGVDTHGTCGHPCRANPV